MFSVRGQINPDDLGTGGLTAAKLVSSSYWLNSPSFLQNEDDSDKNHIYKFSSFGRGIRIERRY